MGMAIHLRAANVESYKATPQRQEKAPALNLEATTG
jgi:hypothetical protein